MNFRRGLFRLWLVLSLAWIGFIAYTGQVAFCATYKHQLQRPTSAV